MTKDVNNIKLNAQNTWIIIPDYRITSLHSLIINVFSPHKACFPPHFLIFNCKLRQLENVNCFSSYRSALQVSHLVLFIDSFINKSCITCFVSNVNCNHLQEMVISLLSDCERLAYYLMLRFVFKYLSYLAGLCNF